jgi:hypothetical protein
MAVTLVPPIVMDAPHVRLADIPAQVKVAVVLPALQENTQGLEPLAAWVAVPAVTHRLVEALRATAVPRGPIPLELTLAAAPTAPVEAILPAVVVPVSHVPRASTSTPPVAARVRPVRPASTPAPVPVVALIAPQARPIPIPTRPRVLRARRASISLIKARVAVPIVRQVKSLDPAPDPVLRAVPESTRTVTPPVSRARPVLFPVTVRTHALNA